MSKEEMISCLEVSLSLLEDFDFEQYAEITGDEDDEGEEDEEDEEDEE